MVDMYTILVVDDTLHVADVFVTMLEEGGYCPLVAHSGQECLDLLATTMPDLLLLDVMMTPMDGWTTLEKIKEDPATMDLPVLMLTSKLLTPAQAEQYSVLIEDYVLKPITNFELYDTIEHVLRRRQAILSDVERAWRCGIDGEVISEYARLAKSIEVNRRFLTILENTYKPNKPPVPVSDNILQALKNLEGHLKTQEARHRQIKEEIKEASREPVPKPRSR